MKEKHSYSILSSMITWFCVVYTVSIIVDTVLAAISGNTIYLNIEFLVWSIAFYSAPLLPLSVFIYLWHLNDVGVNDYIFWLSILLHYVISGGLLMFYRFIQGFFISISPSTYWTTLRHYTIIYIIVLIGAVVNDLIQTSAANKNLRKIQASQCNYDKD